VQTNTIFFANIIKKISFLGSLLQGIEKILFECDDNAKHLTMAKGK
jgi:hypothetical protein